MKPSGRKTKTGYQLSRDIGSPAVCWRSWGFPSHPRGWFSSINYPWYIALFCRQSSQYGRPKSSKTQVHEAEHACLRRLVTFPVS